MAHEIYLQQAVRKIGGADFDTFGQDECALELSCCNTAIKVFAGTLLSLFATHDELVVLNHDLQLITRKAGHGQSDAQALALALMSRDALDIVGG